MPAALEQAWQLQALSFAAVRHLLLCRIEGKPPRLDLENYPHWPVPCVATTAASDYLPLLDRRSAGINPPPVLLDHPLKALRLPTMLPEYDKVAQQCAAEAVDYLRFLLRLVALELLARERRAIERRIKDARFDTSKTLDTFDFLAIPSLNKQLVLDLARGDSIDRRENVLALGNSGTGKTHVALALGWAACQKGYRARCATAAALVHELIEARDEKRLLRLQKQLAAFQLLIVDELGLCAAFQNGRGVAV